MFNWLGLKQVVVLEPKPGVPASSGYLGAGARYLVAHAREDGDSRGLSGRSAVGGIPKGVQKVLRELYPACENISVDYAVLEKAPRVVGIPCDIGWSDVGSWNAV